MTKRGVASLVDEFDLRDYFNRAQLTPLYASFVAEGHYALDEANRRMLHAVWRVLAQAVGVRYD
jgi:hypothetical protein